MNTELLTYEATMRHRELRHALEQQRLLAHLPSKRNNAARHTIALCGIMLIRVGMKLKQAELYGEPRAI